MSDRAFLLAEIRCLREQIGVISLQLSELVAEVNNISDYELVDSVEPPTPRVQPKAKAIRRSPVRGSGPWIVVQWALAFQTAHVRTLQKAK